MFTYSYMLHSKQNLSSKLLLASSELILLSHHVILGPNSCDFMKIVAVLTPHHEMIPPHLRSVFLLDPGTGMHRSNGPSSIFPLPHPQEHFVALWLAQDLTTAWQFAPLHRSKTWVLKSGNHIFHFTSTIPNLELCGLEKVSIFLELNTHISQKKIYQTQNFV